MSNNEKLIVDAMRERYIEVVAQGDRTKCCERGAKDKTGKIEIPPDEVWLGYAQSAIRALGI